MQPITTFLFVLIFIVLLALYFYYIVYPYQEEKRSRKYTYPMDYENIIKCISKAANREQLRMCYTSISLLVKRNKGRYRLEEDTRHLKKLLELKNLQLKKKGKK